MGDPTETPQPPSHELFYLLTAINGPHGVRSPGTETGGTRGWVCRLGSAQGCYFRCLGHKKTPASGHSLKTQAQFTQQHMVGLNTASSTRGLTLCWRRPGWQGGAWSSLSGSAG